MVLEHLGVVMTEEEACALTDTTGLLGGTDAFLLVEAARKLNFAESSKNNLTLQELLLALKQGFFPIVYFAIQLRPSTPVQRHAAVVIEISEHGVLLLDPERGEVMHTVNEFNEMWGLMRGLTILVG